MVPHLIKRRVCGEQYTASKVTKFRLRANNYKITHHNICRGKKLQIKTKRKIKNAFMSIVFLTVPMELTTGKLLL